MANISLSVDCEIHCCEIDHCYTQVVVIGNGPSGICMSYFLSGNWPYYNGQPHQLEFLQQRLIENQGISILEQDLEYLSSGLEGRSSNPVSLLFDNLHHPNADMGAEEESCLQWIHDKNRQIPHVVLGNGLPGGTWQQMDDTLLTLSLSNWMELPGMEFKKWLQDTRLQNDESARPDNNNRANVSEVAQYYTEYVRKMNLGDNFYSNVKVTSVKKLTGMRVINSENGEPEIACRRCRRLEGENMFEVKGIARHNDLGTEEPFCIFTPNVVLATGTSDDPNRLFVPGEDLNYVSHNLKKLEEAIVNEEIVSNSDPVLIVGAGLSAADAILYTQSLNIPVMHAFRRKASNKNQPLRSLPKLLYPEYNLIYNMMNSGPQSNKNYLNLQQHTLVEFRSDRTVLLKNSEGTEREIKVSHACVLIGSKPKLDFLPDNGKSYSVHTNSPVTCKGNPIHVDPYTMESNMEPGLYAIGPLVGDNFVRFLQGGALAVASNLIQKKTSSHLSSPNRLER
ncbi:oxidative stress-induced growth inhibitor 1-like [Anneissia japonica]|uniref:oxidative stress-induced growth inhibitor 1-like n=1 Tax=Anneissia japonica TaxID=1529436 RepID=UPI0014255EEB|nr:oxidative stress-induced growth inhibitor 1-like [Anneissia japonica]